jgi:hypothetical protein
MDDDEFVRWLTYAQLAESRGISKASATRMAFRYKWRRQVGNDHVTRVAVPVGQDKPPEVPVRVAKQDDTRDGSTPGAMDWQAAVDSLSEARQQAEEYANEANKRADVAVALADRTLTQLAEAHSERAAALARAERAEALVGNLEADVAAKEEAAEHLRAERDQAREAEDQARQHVREAEDAIAELRQAEAVRRGQGRWRRTWLAWRGD